MTKVIKRNGEIVPFNSDKIYSAMSKANAESDSPLPKEKLQDIADYIDYKLSKRDEVTIEEIQDMVEDQLMEKGGYDVARKYIRYRYEHAKKRESNEIKAVDASLLSNITVIKKNNVTEKYDGQKLIKAINQSAIRARNYELTTEESNMFLALIENRLVSDCNDTVKTETLHSYVEKYMKKVAPDVADAYINYHSFRMSQAKNWESVMGRCTTLIGDSTDDDAMTQKNQNANADATLASTMRCFFADYTGESYYENFFLTQEEKQLADLGIIYIHDKNGRDVYPNNCCLFNMGYVLENGCEVNGVHYNQPKTVDVMFDVMGDLILSAASQQYGGFTVPRIDSIVAPYAEKSYNIYLNKYLNLGVDKELAEKQAYEDTKKDIYAGFKGLEIKLNTVASSRGDYPFTTITFGLDTTRWGRVAAIAALDTRRGGQGARGKKKPVLFPKLVFLFDENLHTEGKINYDVFEAGIECSRKTMYPDWLSLTGEGYVPSMYKKYGVNGVISPMGCRAFLSPYYEIGKLMDNGERDHFYPAEDTEDTVVFEGRFNLGVISLNLPMILAESRKQSIDFYEYLDYVLNVIRKNHKRTREYLNNMKASRNPFAFCYGGFYKGNLGPNDKIAPVLESSTMSFGITALNELQQLYNEKSLVEDGEFALEVMKHINDKIDEFKHEDHILYAIYGTPAENLCGKQVKQFRARFGIVKNVSDRDYVSNSFHCHVTENITPIQKQDLEYRFWNYFNGGKIQYCKYPIDYNVEAMKTLVLRAMKMGFYEGLNLSLSFCDDCGYEKPEMGNICPKCGGYHITQIDRMNGYLAFTRVGSDTIVEENPDGSKKIIVHTRFSPHKVKEINDRVSM